MKIKLLTILWLILFLSSQLQSQAKPKDAKAAAHSFIQTISSVLPEWKGIKFEKSIIYFDLNNKPVAYSFPIKEKQGFILIGAEDLSLLEFSLNPPAHKRLEFSKERAQNCIGIKRKLEKPQFIYLGLSHYLVRFPFSAEGKRLGKLTVDITSNQIVDGMLIPQPRRKKETVLTKAPLKKSTSVIIRKVPQYNYYISDEATSMAMIFGYWEGRGFSNLRQQSKANPKEKEFNQELIAYIAKGCAGCGERTTIELFASSRGYHIHTAYHTTSPKGSAKLATFTDFKKEIDTHRPLLVKITSLGNLHHYLVGMGYWESEIGNFIICLSPGSEEPYFFNWQGPYDNLSFISITPEK